MGKSLSLITFDSFKNEVRSKLKSEYLVRILRLQLNLLQQDREKLDFGVHNAKNYLGEANLEIQVGDWRNN